MTQVAITTYIQNYITAAADESACNMQMNYADVLHEHMSGKGGM